jgi:hypothetical protein
MKYLLVLTALTLSACNTFNGAVDGSQMIVGTTLLIQLSLWLQIQLKALVQDQLRLLKALPLTFAKHLSKC